MPIVKWWFKYIRFHLLVCWAFYSCYWRLLADDLKWVANCVMIYLALFMWYCWSFLSTCSWEKCYFLDQRPNHILVIRSVALISFVLNSFLSLPLWSLLPFWSLTCCLYPVMPLSSYHCVYQAYNKRCIGHPFCAIGHYVDCLKWVDNCVLTCCTYSIWSCLSLLPTYSLEKLINFLDWPLWICIPSISKIQLRVLLRSIIFCLSFLVFTILLTYKINMLESLYLLV